MNKHLVYFHLAKAMECCGLVEGGVTAVRDAAKRELSDDYFSEEFNDALDYGITHLRENLDQAMRALFTEDETVVKEKG